MKRHFYVMATLFFLIVFVVSLKPACAAEKVIELKLAELFPVTHTLHKMIYVPWAQELEKRTNGRVKVTFYPSEALGKAKDHYDMVSRGIADITDTALTYTPGRFPLSSVMELPLGIPSSKVAGRVMMDLYDRYLKDEFQGVRVQMIIANDPGNIFTTKKPVKSLDDLKGMRIRTSGAQQTLTVKALGASPLMIPAPEVYEALLRGMADGTCFPDSGIIDFKVEDLVKYKTSVNFYSVPSVSIMNLKTWNSFPPDIQKILEEMTGRALAEKATAAFDAHAEESRDVMRKKGAQFIQLPPEEKKLWDAKFKAVCDAWVADIEAKGLPGKKVYQDTLSLIEKYSKQGF